MHEGDKKFKEQWEKTLSEGRIRYALIHGSIFGFAVFLILNLWNLKDKSFVEVYFTTKSLEQALTMVLAGITGYATIKWWMNQSIYKKIIQREKEGHSDPH